MTPNKVCYIIVSKSLRTGEVMNSDVYINQRQAQRRVAELSHTFKEWNEFHIETALLIDEDNYE